MDETVPHDGPVAGGADDAGGLATLPAELGRYRLLRLLGEGGNGRVFEAEDSARPGERLAIKVLHHRSPNSLLRLKQEFRALCETLHPNLVGLRSLERQGERWFIAMDLVPGVDFAHYVRPPGSDRAAPERLRAALLQLLSGVDALHRRGLLHCDLKPSNVLVRDDGHLTIIDFGLVSSPRDVGDVADEPALKLVGTPAYLAPEQVAGDPPSAESDLYAIGVMLYEALTGTLPFDGPRLLEDKLTRDAPPIDRRRHHAPDELASIAELWLARFPVERPLLSGIRAELSRTQQAGPTPAVPQLVGRRTELGWLDRAFARRKREGRAELTFVHGPSGVGKSALVRHQLEHIERHAQALVLRGRARPDEILPFQALDGAIDDLSSALEQGRVTPDELKRVQGIDALVRLFPVLARVPQLSRSLDGSAMDDDARTRARAFHALIELFAALTELRPVVLFIDDLHWLDADSLSFLEAWLTSKRESEVWLLGTYRTDEREKSATLSRLIALASKEATLSELQLGPLPESEAHELACAWLPESRRDAAQLNALLREARGMPFFVTELARHARDTGASGLVDDVVLERARMLVPSARRLLELLSVSPRPLELTLACASADASAGDAHALLRGSFAARVGQGKGEALEVYHDHIRQALKRTAHTERLLSSLARTAERLRPHEAELIYECHLRAGQRTDAARFALPAAERAERVFAYGRAIDILRFLRAASEGDTRRAAELALARVLAKSGAAAEAAELYERLAEGAGASEQRALLAEAMSMHLHSGKLAEGRALLDRLSRETGLAVPHARPLVRLGRDLLHVLRIRLAKPMDETLPEPPPSPDPYARERQKLDVATRAAVGLMPHTYASHGHYALELMRLTRALNDRARWPIAMLCEALLEQGLEGRPSARMDRQVARGCALAHELGSPETLALVLAGSGWYHINTLRLRGAVERFEQADEVLKARGMASISVCNYARVGHYYALLLLGELDTCAALHDLWLDEARAVGDVFGQASMQIMGVHRYLGADDPYAALASWERGMRLSPWIRERYLATPWWRVDVDLYRDDTGSSFAWLASARTSPLWPATARNAAQVGLDVFAHARTALRCLGRGQGGESSFLRMRLDVAQGRMHRSSARSIRLWAPLVKAGAEYVDGKHELAADTLAQAADALDARDLALYAAGARLALARLEDDSAGAREALALFERRGLVNPERYAAMMVPGFEALAPPRVRTTEPPRRLIT